MHKKILTKKQLALLPLLKLFSGKFVLVGGTAIALQLGHRESIDFDLAALDEIDNLSIRRKLKSFHIDRVMRDDIEEFTLLINGVKLTFFQYPFKISASKKLDDFIKLPDLLTLAAMKAYALGRRAKWKDYVDLYFILKQQQIAKIVKKAKHIFGNEFNEKNFRMQLSYFKDLDYTERIVYKRDYKVSDKIIQKELRELSLK